jgi:hypothetical protein
MFPLHICGSIVPKRVGCESVILIAQLDPVPVVREV